MAWFNSGLLGNITAPNQYSGQQNISSSTGTALGTSLASAQAGSIVAVNGGAGQNYWSTAQANSAFSAHQDKMYTLKNYADAIGWDLTHHHLPVGMTSDDPKIAMLKLINVGEVLKDVGVRTSDTDYYVMREPSA
jgi:hypothetical protein